MTDEELINNMAENLEKVLNAALDGNGLHAVQNMAIKDKFYRLIELSRIGASVMPRPLAAAPPAPARHAGVQAGPGYLANPVSGVVCGRGRNPTLRLWPAIFSGEIDVFPSERRNMGQEIGR